MLQHHRPISLLFARKAASFQGGPLRLPTHYYVAHGSTALKIAPAPQGKAHTPPAVQCVHCLHCQPQLATTFPQLPKRILAVINSSSAPKPVKGSAPTNKGCNNNSTEEQSSVLGQMARWFCRAENKHTAQTKVSSVCFEQAHPRLATCRRHGRNTHDNINTLAPQP